MLVEVIMTLVLNDIPAELEAKLRSRAAATGRDVASLVSEAIQEKLAADEKAAQTATAAEQWSAQWHAWADAHRPGTHVVDDSREGIYSGTVDDPR